MVAAADDRVALLADALASLTSADAVVTDAVERAFFSTDVYAAGETAALVVRPGQREDVPSVVRAITSAGFAVVPRGGGMSYTGGYVPERSQSVILDLSALDRIVDVDAEDMTITVEAGVTWKQIYDRLSPLGLRLPFFGTFSGSRATVGGGLSNGALFMGTARYGTAAENALCLDVVTADGRTISTGQAGFHNGRPFYRTYGPDLTGLFVHDAGALGVKTLITMRMMEAPQHTGCASFVLSSGNAAARAMSDIARAGASEEAYVFDPATTKRSIPPADLKRDLKRLLGVVKAEKGWFAGLKAGAKLVGAGRHFADDVYSLHVVCSASTADGVAHDLSRCRDIADRHGGGEIANSIPTAARANPFEPLNGILGADGERWAALNSKVAHSDAAALIEATEAIFARHASAMSAHDVTVSRLFIAISNHAFSFEPVLRWYDEWLPVHRRTPEPDYLANMTEPAPNPAARELVDRIRQEVVELFAERGAASNQIGKTYPYYQSLRPETAAIVRTLKAELDPQGLMNPGALGLPGAAPT
ncbi:MAG: FAD-binding oxidoreductase [Woeseiaceae bacterium]|nr:FAD-binding oxidoreductase [Woeseiaceae bacterium]